MSPEGQVNDATVVRFGTTEDTSNEFPLPTIVRKEYSDVGLVASNDI